MIRASLAFVFSLLVINSVRSQICTGSLGDPIINISFGSGANPGPALSPSVTNYVYVATDCPQDGFYAIRNSSAACHGNTWHTITDHTGNTNGYFMLVNASVYPGAFYTDTVRGLCGNTTYEFAAWIVNVLKATSCNGAGIQPNLTFTLESVTGTILNSYNTGDIAHASSPIWKQYGFYFKTPANNTDVVLRIINNATGGCGNDLALDDITFRPCGPAINTSIAGNTGNNVAFCEGQSKSYTFSANVSAGFNAPEVQWQQSIDNGNWNNIAGATSMSYTKNFTSFDKGIYQFRLTAAESGNMGIAQCRIASTPLTVNIMNNPIIAAKSNSPVCENDTLILSATGSNIAWSKSNAFVSNNNTVIIAHASIQDTGKFYVTVMNGSCFRADSVTVTILNRPLINVSENMIGICKGDTAHIILSGADNYFWTPATHAAVNGNAGLLYPADSTVYLLTGTLNNGCNDTADVSVNVYHRPVADAGTDKTIMEGTSTLLQGFVNGDSITWHWDPPVDLANIYQLATTVNPIITTSYVLNVQSLLGCGYEKDTVTVHVLKKLQIPNAFSPNNDGINDEWRINGIDTYASAEVTIFNRYGGPLYRTTNFTKWDGKINGQLLKPGIYYYIIDVKNNLPVISGWLMIVY